MSTTPFIRPATVESDPELPMIRVTRDFTATPDQVIRAHAEAEIVALWIGAVGSATRIVDWDARDGGSWHYVITIDGEDYGFRGCFHQIAETRMVQTFSFLGTPDDVALETLTVTDLGNGRTRLETRSHYESFDARDAMIAHGMADGVNAGYDKLDQVLAGEA